MQHPLLLESDGLMFLLYIAGFIVCIIVARAIFSVDAFLNHTKLQTDLLEKIARNTGATNEDIKVIMEKFKKRK